MIEKENIGKLVKDYRKQNNLTQEQFAEIICKSVPTIIKYENGDVTPPKKVMENIKSIIFSNILSETEFKEKIRYLTLKRSTSCQVAMKILNYRFINGITQEQFAEKIGKSKRAVEEYENGIIPNQRVMDIINKIIDK